MKRIRSAKEQIIVLARIVLVFLTTFVGPPLQAGDDIPVHLEGTKLVGLSPAYAPAELDLKAGSLRIKNHVMDFTLTVKFLIGSDAKQLTFSVVSSPTVSTAEHPALPPHLVIQHTSEEKDATFEYLFDLETLDLVRINTTIGEVKGPMGLADSEMKAIKASIREVK